MLPTETKLAFYLGAYQDLPASERQRRLGSDLAALAEETRPRGEAPLITPFEYHVDFGRNTVTCPEFSPHDIRTHFTSPDVGGTCQLLLDRSKYEEGVMVIVWISPPSLPGEPESRITLSVSRIVDDQRAEVKCYSGLCTTLSAQDCLQVANRANQFSPDPGPEFTNPETINCSPILVSVPSGLNPYEFVLTSVIPLDDVLDLIVSGRADAEFAEKKAAAQQVAQIIAPALIGLSSPELIRTGARAERMMARLTGTAMVGNGSGCGKLNSELTTESISRTNALEAHGSCPEIFCPVCGWKPNSRELAAIQNGELTCCPNPECHYDPATRTTNPDFQPEHQTTTPPPIFDQPTASGDTSEIYPSWDSGRVDEEALPWIVYFFVPQQENELGKS